MGVALESLYKDLNEHDYGRGIQYLLSVCSETHASLDLQANDKVPKKYSSMQCLSNHRGVSA